MSSSRKVIYFCGSKFGGRQDEILYNILFKKLERYGDVIQPFDPEKGINQIGSRRENRLSMHDRDVVLLTMCDVMVAEVTHPSLGVGYEIGRAVELGKPVLCLYRPLPRKKLSGLLRGMDNSEYLRVIDYDAPDQVDQIFQDFIPNYINFQASKAEVVGMDEEPQFSRQNLGPPGLGIENLTKSQLKNKKRREASKIAGATTTSPSEENKNSSPQKQVDILSDPEKEKKIRRLGNKLASIQKIKQQQAEGKILECNQIEKLSKEQEIIDELNSLNLS